MAFTGEAGAALVFLILYAIMFAYMCVMYAVGRYKWASRFTILWLHALIRVASQSCGVAFGVLAWRNTDVFVAYLILGAEGYFSLTISAYYFLNQYLWKHFGFSPLMAHEKPPKKERRRRIAEMWMFLPIYMPWRYWKFDRIAIVDSWLIPANAIIIAGGSMIAGSIGLQETDPKGYEDRLNLAKALRTAGQAIFLALTVAYGLLVVLTFARASHHGGVTRTLMLFIFVATMLHVRGIFGVLQAAVTKLSYNDPNNYDAHGMVERFTAIEYCLAVLPEFVAAACLNCSYWTTEKEEPALQAVESAELGGTGTQYSSDTALRSMGGSKVPDEESK